MLKLAPKNPKALFRRGQARVGLDKLIDAQKGMLNPVDRIYYLNECSTDFDEALLLEPANKTVADALADVGAKIQAKKAKVRTYPQSRSESQR